MDVAVEGPAMATRSWPLMARGVAPKTGAAMKEAPAEERRVDMEAVVFGWTVVVSTMILSRMEPDWRIWEVTWLSASSLLTYLSG